MGSKVALVACVGEKAHQAMPAGDLYQSDWFLKAAAYARAVADRWYILSAKYGLVAPDHVIEPYDETLKAKSSAARRAWAESVARELLLVLSRGDTVTVLAGITYRRDLVDSIKAMGCEVEIPMEGLAIGQQLQWLKRSLAVINGGLTR